MAKQASMKASDLFVKALESEGVEYIFLPHKSHLTINLGKFRLPVCSKVLIPEAFYDLKIFV